MLLKRICLNPIVVQQAVSIFLTICCIDLSCSSRATETDTTGQRLFEMPIHYFRPAIYINGYHTPQSPVEHKGVIEEYT